MSDPKFNKQFHIIEMSIDPFDALQLTSEFFKMMLTIEKFARSSDLRMAGYAKSLQDYFIEIVEAADCTKIWESLKKGVFENGT